MNDKEEKRILTDDERFPLVRQMWDMMLSGNYTPQQIRKIANEQWGFRMPKHKKMGGGEISIATIYKLFSNIFYTGMFEWSGTLYQGKHTPLVSLEEFDRVQVLLGRKTSPRAQKHEFAFTGMFRCGYCNSTVTAMEKNKFIKTKLQWKSFKYYHCTRKLKHDVKCTNAPIPACGLEKMIVIELERYTIAPDFLGWAIEILHAESNNLKEETNRIKANREKKLAEVQGELENLTRMRYREMINDAEFMAEKGLLSAKIVKLKSQISEETDYDKQYIELTERAFRFAAFAQQNFIKGTKKGKREIVNTLARTTG